MWNVQRSGVFEVKRPCGVMNAGAYRGGSCRRRKTIVGNKGEQAGRKRKECECWGGKWRFGSRCACVFGHVSRAFVLLLRQLIFNVYR